MKPVDTDRPVRELVDGFEITDPAPLKCFNRLWSLIVQLRDRIEDELWSRGLDEWGVEDEPC